MLMVTIVFLVFAKRKALAVGLTQILIFYIMVLYMYPLFAYTEAASQITGGTAYTEASSALVLAITQMVCSTSVIVFWERFHGTASAEIMSIVAPMFPIGAEVVRLCTFLRAARHPQYMKLGCGMLVSGVTMQTIIRSQFGVSLTTALLRGRCHVITAERDVILRSYLGFSYVPVYAGLVLVGYSIDRYH